MFNVLLCIAFAFLHVFIISAVVYVLQILKVNIIVKLIVLHFVKALKKVAKERWSPTTTTGSFGEVFVVETSVTWIIFGCGSEYLLMLY